MGLDTVLVALGDGDDHRVSDLATTTIDLAGPAGATVELAHVFTDETYDRIRRDLGIDPDDEVTPTDVARRYRVVREIGTELDDAGVPYRVHGTKTNGGTEGDRIVALADDLDADLLLVGGRRRSPTGKAVFGSTAQTAMLNAPCPVTFVRVD